MSSNTCLGIGQGGRGPRAGSSQTFWQCSQKNRIARREFPNSWSIALVLITCNPFCWQVGHTEKVSRPSFAMKLSWTDNMSSGRIAIYWPGGRIGCTGMFIPVPELQLAMKSPAWRGPLNQIVSSCLFPARCTMLSASGDPFRKSNSVCCCSTWMSSRTPRITSPDTPHIR